MNDTDYKALLDNCRDQNGKIQTEAGRRAQVNSTSESPVIAASKTFVSAIDAEKATLSV